MSKFRETKSNSNKSGFIFQSLKNSTFKMYHSFLHHVATENWEIKDNTFLYKNCTKTFKKFLHDWIYNGFENWSFKTRCMIFFSNCKLWTVSLRWGKFKKSSLYRKFTIECHNRRLESLLKIFTEVIFLNFDSRNRKISSLTILMFKVNYEEKVRESFLIW